MAMKIGERKNPVELQLRHWMRLVPDSETSRTAFKDVVLNLCERIESKLDDCTEKDVLENISRQKIIKTLAA